MHSSHIRKINECILMKIRFVAFDAVICIKEWIFSRKSRYRSITNCSWWFRNLQCIGLKETGVYMIIKNLPSKHHSRLQNIFLVALRNSDDLNTKTTDIIIAVGKLKYHHYHMIDIDPTINKWFTKCQYATDACLSKLQANCNIIID